MFFNLTSGLRGIVRNRSTVFSEPGLAKFRFGETSEHKMRRSRGGQLRYHYCVICFMSTAGREDMPVVGCGESVYSKTDMNYTLYLGQIEHQ